MPAQRIPEGVEVRVIPFNYAHRPTWAVHRCSLGREPDRLGEIVQQFDDLFDVIVFCNGDRARHHDKQTTTLEAAVDHLRGLTLEERRMSAFIVAAADSRERAKVFAEAGPIWRRPSDNPLDDMSDHELERWDYNNRRAGRDVR